MRSHVTPPKIKYVLQYTDSNLVLQSIDVTDDFANWKSFATDIVRDDLTGAFIQIQDGGISFTGESYELVKEIYELQSFRAQAKLIVSVRKDTFPDLWSYEQKVVLDLNFATYTCTNTTIELEANENGLKSMIKSNASQKYDIPVETLTPDILEYDGLEIKETLTWTSGEIMGVPPLANQYNGILYPSIYASDQDVNANYNNPFTQDNQVLAKRYTPIGGTIDEIREWNGTDWPSSNNNQQYKHYIIQSKFAKQFTFSLNATLNANFGYALNVAYLYLVCANTQEKTLLHTFGGSTIDYHEVIDKTIIVQNNTDGLNYYLELDYQYHVDAGILTAILALNKFEFESGGSVQIEWLAMPKANISIPIVSERKLVQALVDNLTETTGVYTALVDEHDENIRIAAGESIRNFEKQYLHTSFSDFATYMKSCWGYEYDIDGNTIRFSLREKFFSSEPALAIPEINNFKFSVNQDYVYTGVKIGIALIQYQSINGVDEFRFIEEWSTGVKNVINVLDLTSPYRTDAYGFQLLSDKQYKKNSTDDQSDNGIFVVHVIPDNGKYILDRNAVITGVASPGTMFNAIFSPRKCLERNASLLGVSTSVLRFTSGLGNADISINGVSEKEPINIESSLFTPDILDCDIGEIVDLPTEKNGLVSCSLNGKVYNGFIKKLSHYWGADQKTSATFFLKSITRDSSRDIDYDPRDYSPLDYKTK